MRLLPLAAPVAILALLACNERDRPGVVDPDVSASLQAAILQPRTLDNATTIAGRLLFVTVQGAEPGGRLIGVGLLVHRQPGRFVDSLAVRFAPTTDSTHVFAVAVPDTLPNNSQLDLRGIAYGPGGVARLSQHEAVIVLQCPPNASFC